MEKVCFKTKKGPAALGPYSTATIYGGMIFMSGMIGVNPQTGKAPEGGACDNHGQTGADHYLHPFPSGPCGMHPAHLE